MVLNLIVLALAVWRVSTMLEDVTEAGPGDMLHWIRIRSGVKFDEMSEAYGTNWLSKGLLCHRCSSIWFGTVGSLALLLVPEIAFYIALALALSAATVLLER